METLGDLSDSGNHSNYCSLKTLNSCCGVKSVELPSPIPCWILKEAIWHVKNNVASTCERVSNLRQSPYDDYGEYHRR